MELNTKKLYQNILVIKKIHEKDTIKLNKQTLILKGRFTCFTTKLMAS